MKPTPVCRMRIFVHFSAILFQNILNLVSGYNELTSLDLIIVDEWNHQDDKKLSEIVAGNHK